MVAVSPRGWPVWPRLGILGNIHFIMETLCLDLCASSSIIRRLSHMSTSPPFYEF